MGGSSGGMRSRRGRRRHSSSEVMMRLWLTEYGTATGASAVAFPRADVAFEFGRNGRVDSTWRIVEKAAIRSLAAASGRVAITLSHAPNCRTKASGRRGRSGDRKSKLSLTRCLAAVDMRNVRRVVLRSVLQSGGEVSSATKGEHSRSLLKNCPPRTVLSSLAAHSAPRHLLASGPGGDCQ